jgi:predicted nuclease of restriction endonuclease-like (RecB) superfamily
MLAVDSTLFYFIASMHPKCFISLKKLKSEIKPLLVKNQCKIQNQSKNINHLMKAQQMLKKVHRKTILIIHNISLLI